MCSATRRGSEEGTISAVGAFSDAIERVELREALAEVSVEARELRGRLQHATAVARETETAAAAEREELRRLRAQLAQ